MTAALTPEARAREVARLRALADREWNKGSRTYQAGLHTITGEERALLLLDEADRLEAEATLTEKSDER